MEQLSALDATFLYAETPSTPMHVTPLFFYDQSALDSPLRFKEIMAHIESRLGASKVFRRKLLRVPFDIDHPYWVNDNEFDLEFHVRHIALPKPGDWRQFCIQASRIHSRALDLTRPPWEIYVIEGLDNVDGMPPGSFAIMMKVHHAAVDGHSANEMTASLHDLLPKRQRSFSKFVVEREEAPGQAELLSRAMLNNTVNSMNMGMGLMKLIPNLSKAAAVQANRTLKQVTAGTKAKGSKVPATIFNGPVSASRVMDARHFPLDGFKAIRAAVEGATINDAVLTVTGGGIARYLEKRGEAVEGSLFSACPISVRTKEEHHTAGNQVSMMIASLCTDITDPMARLKAVRTATGNAKETMGALGARDLTDIHKSVPAATMMTAARLLMTPDSALNNLLQSANCGITNVPGPQTPLYLNGARLLFSTGLLPLMHGVGLAVTVTSYAGVLTICFTADRAMVPDPELLSACIAESYEATLAAATGTPTTTSGVKSKKPRQNTGRKDQKAK